MTLPTSEATGRRGPRPGPSIEVGPQPFGRDRETRRELAKLTATFLNGIAIAILAVGGLIPAVAFLIPGLIPSGSGVVIASTVLMSFIIGALLHLAARAVLRREYRR